MEPRGAKVPFRACSFGNNERRPRRFYPVRTGKPAAGGLRRRDSVVHQLLDAIDNLSFPPFCRFNTVARPCDDQFLDDAPLSLADLASSRIHFRYTRHHRVPNPRFLFFLTLSERMPPYSRHHKYSKEIECRHRGGKNKNNSRLLLEL